jgi:DNA uptake protein ComE-like DNA-binding protein
MRLHYFAAASFTAGLMLLGIACSPNETPDQIRQQTAQAAHTAKEDTRAVAEGMKEGLSSKKSVDLNKGSKDDLLTLPGITPASADHIIAERPYENAHQLVSRHVLSEDEYSRIRDKVVTQ